MTPFHCVIAALALLVLACVLDRFVNEHAGDVAVMFAYTALAFGFSLIGG